MASFLPSLTEYDPPDGEEGTLDPLGLALLATRIAEVFVPGFTERLRRPRFFTAIALGTLVLSRRDRYPEGVYGIERDGPAYLAWERLFVESFAQSGKNGDDGLLGVPGIQKARDAKASKARLSSQLYLKNPAAVGVWVAYKGLAVEVGLLDKEGRLADAGEELIGAWARGTNEANPLKVGGDKRVAELDEALAPLLGRGASKGSPHGVWEMLHRSLHPSGITRPEAELIEGLLRNTSPQRERVFSFVERSGEPPEGTRNPDEFGALDSMASSEDPELAWRARLASRYEALVGQVVSALACMLFAAAQERTGAVSAKATLAHNAVGPVFGGAPARVKRALSEFDAALRAAEGEAARDAGAAKELREISDVEARSLSWLRAGALEAPEPLFDALIKRHFEAQKRKPPAGKRPWIEGEEGHYSVRLRFMEDKPPAEDGRLQVHGYRTRAVRSCLRDLRRTAR